MDDEGATYPVPRKSSLMGPWAFSGGNPDGDANGFCGTWKTLYGTFFLQELVVRFVVDTAGLKTCMRFVLH